MTDTTASPRPAATIIVVRDGFDALEVLMVQRGPQQRFMAGVWVFPGGAVDAADRAAAGGDDDLAERIAAVRELEEEAAVAGVDPAALIRFSRWITPVVVPIRFDTHFFLATMPEAAAVRIDGAECVDFRWTAPAAALTAHREGSMPMVFPTIKHLEQLAEFRTVAALVTAAAAGTVVPVTPQVLGGEHARIVLPGDPGYEDPAPAA